MKKLWWSFVVFIFLVMPFVHGECGSIPTAWCNITMNTTFQRGTHSVYAMAIQADNVVLDCGGAQLVSPQPQNDPNIALSVAGQNNVQVKNCVFDGYHTGITTERILNGRSDLFPLPAFNLSIVNNTFQNIEYAPIYIRHVNRTNVTLIINATLNRTILQPSYAIAPDTRVVIEDNIINVSETSPISYFGVYIENNGKAMIQRNRIFSDRATYPYTVREGYINLKNAKQALVLYNTVKNSLRGISVHGVTRINETSGNVIIFGNNVSRSDEGIRVDGFNNIIVNNTFLNNNVGFMVTSLSLNNYLYANRMIDNRIQAEDSRNNTFDVLLMGNQWNDYMNDSQGCRDVLPPFGRCDSPYVIDPDSRDRYPIIQGVQFAAGGMPEPVYEVPPIITGVDAPPVVIAGDRVTLRISAFGINKLEGLAIINENNPNTINYSRSETYGTSDPVLAYAIDSPLFRQVNNTFTWQTNASDAGFFNFSISVSDGTTTKKRAISLDVLPRGSMLTFQGQLRIGQTVNLSLFDPLRANLAYVIALSFSSLPGIPLGDGRSIPLNYDPLFSLSVLYPSLIGLVGSVGSLNGEGRAVTHWTVPAVPQIAGVTVYASFITLDPAAPFPQNIASIAPALPIILLP